MKTIAERLTDMEETILNLLARIEELEKENENNNTSELDKPIKKSDN